MADTSGYVHVGFAHGEPIAYTGSYWREDVGDPTYNEYLGWVVLGYDRNTGRSGPSGVQPNPPAPAEGSQGGAGFPALPDPFAYGGDVNWLVLVRITRSKSGSAFWNDEELPGGNWDARHSFGPLKLYDPHQYAFTPLETKGAWLDYGPASGVTIATSEVPAGERACDVGGTEASLPNLPPDEDEVVATGLYDYTPHGWTQYDISQIPGPSVGWYFAPMDWSVGTSHVTFNFPYTTDEPIRRKWTIGYEIVLYPYYYVYGPPGAHYPPDGGGGGGEAFLLDMDWNWAFLTRMAHAPTGTTNLTWRASNDREATWTEHALAYPGSPSLLCLDNGATLLATSGVSLLFSPDDGLTWTAMASPGNGYYPCLYEARGDVFSPLFCAAHSAASGDGSLLLYRSWNNGGAWDAPLVVTVDGAALTVPAQRPALTGSMAELLLAFQSGGTVHVLKSTDAGATWKEAF